MYNPPQRKGKNMRFLYCGDVVGRAGRKVIYENLTRLRSEYKLDVILVNVENAAHGFGVTTAIARDFLAHGADVLVTGNHFLNQKDIKPFLDECKVIVRPANIPNINIGRGVCEFELPDGRKLVVAQISGCLFMHEAENMIDTMEGILKNYTMGKNCAAIFVDIHAEATSEKLALGYYLDGRVSCVAGTHTHVPTADARILPNKTAYITDVGMCGDYNSVLGFEIQAPINRLKNRDCTDKLTPANGKGTIYGIVVETDDTTGLAKSIEQIRYE